jgi:hypothetical protein
MGQCAAKGCEHFIDPSKLMCRRHWGLVSRDTQREINNAWHGRPRDVEGYRVAREKGIGEVEAREAHIHNPNQGAFDL